MDPICSEIFWSAMSRFVLLAVAGVYLILWGTIRSASIASRAEEEEAPK